MENAELEKQSVFVPLTFAMTERKMKIVEKKGWILNMGWYFF